MYALTSFVEYINGLETANHPACIIYSSWLRNDRALSSNRSKSIGLSGPNSWPIRQKTMANQLSHSIVGFVQTAIITGQGDRRSAPPDASK
jgi:hypothetical protein